MLLNCGVREDSWGAPGLQGDPTIHYKGNQSWIFIWRTDVEAETPILWPPNANNWLIWKDPDTSRERLKAGGAGDNRRWQGWMASLTQWIWVWVNSRSWWWTARPGVLYSKWLQRGRHDWVTELNCRMTQNYIIVLKEKMLTIKIWFQANFISFIYHLIMGNSSVVKTKYSIPKFKNVLLSLGINILAKNKHHSYFTVSKLYQHL